MLGRVELEDGTLFDDGLIVDPYGDECGELFVEKSVGVDWNLDGDSPA